jgi:hypothetical protein
MFSLAWRVQAKSARFQLKKLFKIADLAKTMNPSPIQWSLNGRTCVLSCLLIF